MKKNEFTKNIMNEIKFIKTNFNDKEDIFGGSIDNYALEVGQQNIYNIMYYTFEEIYGKKNSMNLANNLCQQIINSVLDGKNVNQKSIEGIYIDFVYNSNKFKKEVGWK